MRNVLATILVFVIAFSFYNHFILTAGKEEAVAARVKAEATLADTTQATMELRLELEPEIAGLKDDNVGLQNELFKRDLLIENEQEKNRRLEEELVEIKVDKAEDVVMVLSREDDELVDASLRLIPELYPYLEGQPEYGFFDGVFESNRPTAEAFTFALTEVQVGRRTIINASESVDTAKTELKLTQEQRENLRTQLFKEQTGHGKTGELLDAERQRQSDTINLVSKLNDEVAAYRKQLSFDLFRPKCGIGGFAGVALGGDAAVGVGLTCGWSIF
jgi:hypothetical protein